MLKRLMAYLLLPDSIVYWIPTNMIRETKETIIALGLTKTGKTVRNNNRISLLNIIVKRIFRANSRVTVLENILI